MKDSKLIDFLISLGTEPEVLRRYQQDRNAAMSAAGLSAEEKTLLSQGNQHQLKAAIVASGGTDKPSRPPPATPNEPDEKPGIGRPPPGPPSPGPGFMQPPPGSPQPGPPFMHAPAKPKDPSETK